MKKSKFIQIGKHKIRRSTKEDEFKSVEKLLEEAKMQLACLEWKHFLLRVEKIDSIEIKDKIAGQKLLIRVIEEWLL